VAEECPTSIIGFLLARAAESDNAVMKVAFYVSLSLLFVIGVRGQQVASVDLTHPPTSDPISQNQIKPALPDGCEKILPGVIADGFVQPEDHQPREVTVEITSLSADKVPVDSELRADVRLSNNGKQSIQIPWSTDPRTAKEGQGSGHLDWEAGTFEVLLRGQRDNDVLLKSLTYPLYGSKFSPGSLLTMQPGESVVATIEFKMEAQYPVHPGPWKEGKMELLVKWKQTARSQHVVACKMANGYFRYNYEQKNLTILIQVLGRDSSTKSLANK
jgi:hypothetical protein